MVLHSVGGWCGAGRAVVLLALAALPVQAENLLANPGSEELAADRPVRWDHFVQPKPGAAAAVSDEAYAGAYAITLHTPTPYDREPVNNWSQNIIADLGGQQLRVSGYIRVAEAKEAALWIQYWRKRPWGVIDAHSTSTDMPVYGTQDWQEVSMTVDVPEGTDFVTIRCVLMGTGSAWFDDIAVTQVTEVPPAPAAKSSDDAAAPAAPAPAAPAAVSTPVPASGTPDLSSASGAVAPVDANAITPPAAAAPDSGGSTEDKVLPMVNQLEAEVRRLRDANGILTGTLEDIQSVNQALLREMLAVQAELQALRAERDAAGAPPLAPARPRTPPLMPLSAAEEAIAP